MAVELYGAGATHARSLIDAGSYDDTTAWSFSTEDGDKLLGPKGDDWTAYSSFHLGEDTAAAGDTKAQWKYPFGKAGKVFGAALCSIRSRASQQGATAIFDEAGRLLDQIEQREGDTAARGRVLPFARGGQAQPRQTSGYRVVRNAAGDGAEMYLYGIIGGGSWFDAGGVTADQFRRDLTALGAIKTIDVRVNSEGGDVFEAAAIHTLLKNHAATVTMHIDGLAASAASYICMAGTEIRIAEGAFMMIHNASSFAFGGARELRKTAYLLDTVDVVLAEAYAARSKCPVDQVKTMMADETWMDGKTAVASGFADILVANMQIAAAVRDLARFRHLPAALRPKRVAALGAIERMRALAR